MNPPIVRSNPVLQQVRTLPITRPGKPISYFHHDFQHGGFGDAMLAIRLILSVNYTYTSAAHSSFYDDPCLFYVMSSDSL